MKTPAFFQNLRRAPRKLLTIIIPIALFLAGWWFGLPPSEKHANGPSGMAGEEIWTCSMHPQIRQPEFGPCPICGMDLILLTESGEGGLRELSISDEAAALLDIRVAPVVRAPAEIAIQLFGRISHDERRMSAITARIGGRIDKLYIDYTGKHVSDGDPVAEIYSPDLLVAQRELISARKSLAGSSGAVLDTRRRLYDAAREKLRLLQIPEDQIRQIENADGISDTITIRSPESGIVDMKMVKEGDYVSTGDILFKIADHSALWLQLEAYESDLVWLEPGQSVSFTVEALPGESFSGEIDFIDHVLDPMRRIVRIRANVPNPHNLLKPGMFANAIVKSRIAAPDPLLVPASAVLKTGNRAVVYVRLKGGDGPVFEGREIVPGPRIGEQYIVESGVSEGELVVSRGAFKLDSELQIRAKPSMMNPTAGLNEMPAHSAPEILAAQWAPVPRSLGRLLKDPSMAGLGEIKALVSGIDGAGLQPDELNLWVEFSRKLLNDLQIAENRMEQGPEVAAGMTARAIEQAGRYLGLPYAPVASPSGDPETAAELRQILQAYQLLATALAADDDSAAASAAASLASEMEASSVADIVKLAPMAKATAVAKDIASRRPAFKPLSAALIALVRKRGIDAVGNAYVVHCPMAFEGKGADWLSNKPEVVNPYYGVSMLDCGAVTDTLSTE